MIGFLFAQQRSGTGALGSVLDKHPELKYLGEVLHPDDQSNPDNFFRYLKETAGQAVQFAEPATRFSVVEGYFANVINRYPGVLPIIDVKYRSVHNWNGGWQGLIEAPWIFRHIAKKQWPVVHLKRANSLETFVSGRLAEENKLWHASAADQIRVHSIVVDIRQLSRFITDTAEEVRLMDQWLVPCRRLYVLDYASAFDTNAMLTKISAAHLRTTLQLHKEFSDLKPSFVKQASSKVTECIDNIALVERALRGSEFEWMISGSRDPKSRT
jgi:hypothetical protein